MVDHLRAPEDTSYSTSESAQSPDMSITENHDADWLQWPQDSTLPMESLFGLDMGDMNFADSMPMLEHVGDASTYIDSSLLHQLSCENTDNPSVSISALSDSSGKRKMSDSSDNIFDRRSLSGTSLSSVEHGASSETPVVKRRNTKGPKVSHNVIEKRYRSNLNDKIFELRDTVPELIAEVEAGNNKHPKGKIITCATSYIKQLEAANRRLKKENERLTNKLHDPTSRNKPSTISKVIVGGLAGMVALNGMSAEGHEHPKRSMSALPIPLLDRAATVIRVLLIVGALLYIFLPSLISAPRKTHKHRLNQPNTDHSLHEDVQDDREAFHSNVSAMLEMPCDQPGLVKRILQGLFLLAFETLLGESWWNRLINRGMDYAMSRQRSCQLLIESQLLGGDKSITKAKLLLSAVQSLGFKMNKEMRAIHFAMVSHGVLSPRMIRWCISLFWSVNEDESVLSMPLHKLLDSRVMEAFWHWTTGVEDSLITDIRSDSSIYNPLQQLAAIHACLLQRGIMRDWIRGDATTSEVDDRMNELLRLAPSSSRVYKNSIYLKTLVEPSDWIESAMRSTLPVSASEQGVNVSLQLRSSVLLNLVESNTESEEVADLYEMIKSTSTSHLPGYLSRMLQTAITKHRLDDEEGIAEALSRFYLRLSRQEVS